MFTRSGLQTPDRANSSITRIRHGSRGGHTPTERTKKRFPYTSCTADALLLLVCCNSSDRKSQGPIFYGRRSSENTESLEEEDSTSRFADEFRLGPLLCSFFFFTFLSLSLALDVSPSGSLDLCFASFASIECASGISDQYARGFAIFRTHRHTHTHEIF